METTLSGNSFCFIFKPNLNYHLIIYSTRILNVFLNLCSENVTAYANLVSELDKRVKSMVFESYGVGNALRSHMESTKYLMRMIKYRVPKEKEMNLGAFPHTDKSFLTILHQNEVNGLQIKTRDNKWIQYHPFSSSSTSSFIVMAGDAFFVSSISFY